LLTGNGFFILSPKACVRLRCMRTQALFLPIAKQAKT